MRTKVLINAVFAGVIALLIGCASASVNRKEAKGASVVPVASTDTQPVLNDRSTWLDSPTREF